MAYSINAKDYFKTKLYTGTGSAPNAQTGVGFKPDLLWIKPRNLANSNRLHSPLLTAPDYYVMSENTDAEATNNNSVTSFDTDGFTLGNTDNGWNGSYNYVAWNWKAAGTSGSANTDGSINSTVSANTTSGFSIVKYGDSTGTQTVGHGLGSDVKVLIIKNLTSTNNWHVWHAGIPTSAIHLNESGAKTDSWFATYQNSTAPTSSVFTVKSGGGDDTLGSSKDYIAYCFAEKKGFSKFGSYTGNGSTDGPFIFCGFKPAWVLYKVASGTTNDWTLLDNKRDSFNVAGKRLYPNNTGAESEAARVDFTANGFKLRGDGTDMNGSGNTYIYMAFAEHPLVASNGDPATAR